MTCFVCGKTATHYQREEFGNNARIHFCADCIEKARIRYDYVKAVRVHNNRKHLVVGDIQACQKRPDMVKERVNNLHEVTCTRCLQTLFKHGVEIGI